jgi:hypothetical protein
MTRKAADWFRFLALLAGVSRYLVPFDVWMQACAACRDTLAAFRYVAAGQSEAANYRANIEPEASSGRTV